MENILRVLEYVLGGIAVILMIVGALTVMYLAVAVSHDMDDMGEDVCQYERRP